MDVKHALVWLLAGCVLSATAAPQNPVTEPLSLRQALPIVDAQGRAIDNLQPSGLAYCDDRLLMVSDRHNDWVFELRVEGEQAVARPYRHIAPIPEPDLTGYDFGARWWSKLNRRYDWEGISCDQDRLYLLSESLAQVLVREPSGDWRWLGNELYLAGRERGLFEQLNAFAEGLAVSGERMLVAAERHPRGLVQLQYQPPENRWRVSRAVRIQPFPSLLEPVDFAALWLEPQALFTLERNRRQLCRRSWDDFAVARCWSYEQVETSRDYGYQSRRFGIAEGLARSADRLYIVVDNNADQRLADAADRRPQLWVFKLPPDWLAH